jgi:AAA ATPase domain
MAETPPNLIPSNPFRPGAGTKPLYLAGRTHEKDEFERSLKQRPVVQNLIITGLRGVGKTVLLDELKPIAQSRGWLWTGNDLSEATSLNESRIANRIVVDLSALLAPIIVQRQEELPFGFTSRKQTKERPLNYEDLWGIYTAAPGLIADKLKTLLLHVARLVEQTPIKGVVFAYDEAQNLSDHTEKDEFPLSLLLDVFSFLQRQEMKCQFLLVLTGLPTLVPKLNEARTFTERMFHTLLLERLNQSDAKEAIVKPIEISKSTLTFSQNVIDQVASDSNGYPFFIQFICKEVFDAWIGKMTVGLAPSVPRAEIMAKLDQDFFVPRWQRATDRQQEFMQVIATLVNSEDEFSVPEIARASKQILRKPFSPSHAIQILGNLADKGLIYRNRRGLYCFAVPLLSKFIQRQTWDPATLRDQAGVSSTGSQRPS